MFCSKCGNKLKDDSLFCSQCGLKVTSRKCNTCGSEIADNDTYCTECGSKADKITKSEADNSTVKHMVGIVTNADIEETEIKHHLLKNEDVVWLSDSQLSLQLENQKRQFGFDAAVTNKRTIFAKKNKMDEVIHNQISSFSWERRENRFHLILAATSIGLALLFNKNATLLFTFVIFCIFAIFMYINNQPEFLVIYSSGRKLNVSGDKETLEDLMSEVNKFIIK